MKRLVVMCLIVAAISFLAGAWWSSRIPASPEIAIRRSAASPEHTLCFMGGVVWIGRDETIACRVEDKPR